MTADTSTKKSDDNPKKLPQASVQGLVKSGQWLHIDWTSTLVPHSLTLIKNKGRSSRDRFFWTRHSDRSFCPPKGGAETAPATRKSNSVCSWPVSGPGWRENG